ncbi:MAG: AAA family ATPase [Campylobacterota bacterium]|nr:AAA family ATPase [Campylobacterota bacterium]
MPRFHYCKKFKNKIDKENDKSLIYRKIEENSKRKDLKSIGSFNVFAGGIYVLKLYNPKRRVIIEEKNIEIKKNEIKVFFIRDIISNHKFDNIYGKYLYKKLQDRSWLNSNPLSKDDIDSFKQKFNGIQEIKSNKLDFPPKNLTDWLDDFSLKLDNEVFETKEWVKYALDNCEKTGMLYKYINTFRIILEEILNDNISNKLIKNDNSIEIFKYINYSIGIIYSKIDINGKLVIILYAGAHTEQQKDFWEESLENIKNKQIDFNKNLESISRYSYRSYPKWTVSDDVLWLDIQKSKEISNLSLTSEQSDFFRNFKFPYYINGQAGSGKSTMLYYLFSNVYYYKMQGEIEGNIVFLTENKKLLEDTKKYVYDLLSKNPEFNGLSEDEINDSKENFNSFKDYLFDILDERDKSEFNKDKYLDFSLFKTLYENSKLSNNIKKKYSAEESWFTIITYIYGHNLKETIKSKNYRTTIARDSQVISLSKFEGIENDVLPFYEKLLDDGYWDKLKIIRYINDNINLSLKDKYSVIICDEAQDFCKVELEFILGMSEYLKYDLSNITQVPVIFAGDPNQTVNPTGFRQDEMTSLLYSQLKDIGFEYYKDSNLYNPSLNYRSAQPVVTLANFIQYYRVRELGIKQKNPQEAKSPVENIDFNIFLNYEDIESDYELQDDLIKKLKYKIFIVPIDYQEKDSYIENSNLLSQIENIEVKTSTEAKGAEYEQVVLYGFGEYFLDRFKSLEATNNDNDEKFKIGYFFNKLYVAITRAQTELIIIDTIESQENFWKILVDNVSINKTWETLKKEHFKVIEYNTGSIKNILESTSNNALENALQDKKQGVYHNNSARLRVASNQFFRLGKDKEANECLALAEEIKNNYKGAGEYFLKSGDIEKASMSYFRGRFFDDVEKIGNNLKTLEQDIRIILGRVMARELLIEKDINILSNNLESLYQLTLNISWRDYLVKELIINSEKIIEVELKKEFVKVLKHIRKSTDIELSEQIGQIYYTLEEYKNAINIWEEIDFYEEPYSKAKSIVFQEVVSRYKKNNEIIDDNEAFDIYQSFINTENISEVVSIGIVIEERFKDNLNELNEFYQDIIQNPILEKTIFIYLLKRWVKIYWKINKKNPTNIWLEELNIKYKKYNIDLPYKKFTIDELKNISEFPQNEYHKNINHFSKITIKNFRQFETLLIDDIGMFNLIVGDNNVGKTSLLEALLFISNNDIYFNELAFAYMARNSSCDLPPINFIKDFIRKDNKKQDFELILEKDRIFTNYKIKQPTTDDVKNKFTIQTAIDIDDYICMIKDDGICNISEIPLLIKKLDKLEIVKTQFIPFGKGFDRDLVEIYAEKIDRNRIKRKDFLASMEVFIPNIDRITPDTKDGQIYIEEKNCEGDSALSNYGEGAKKLFRILTQITLQQNNKLLIDEIDAGIHYSHFLEFWKVILKVAKENNVQIFATTHNMECIEYFKEVLEEEDMQKYQELSKTITLRKLPNSNIKAYTRQFKEFEYEIDNELEIRGDKL